MPKNSLKDLVQSVLREQIGTRCYSTPGLVIGSSSKAKVKIANTVQYSIGNKLYAKTTAEIAFTNLTVQAANTTKYYLVCLNASGDGLIVNGTASALPDVPSGYCPIGYVKIITDSNSTFTPATTELDAASTFTSVTYVDLAQLPLSV